MYPTLRCPYQTRGDSSLIYSILWHNVYHHSWHLELWVDESKIYKGKETCQRSLVQRLGFKRCKFYTSWQRWKLNIWNLSETTFLGGWGNGILTKAVYPFLHWLDKTVLHFLFRINRRQILTQDSFLSSGSSDNHLIDSKIKQNKHFIDVLNQPLFTSRMWNKVNFCGI